MYETEIKPLQSHRVKWRIRMSDVAGKAIKREVDTAGTKADAP